jgi:hypothetical protein
MAFKMTHRPNGDTRYGGRHRRARTGRRRRI